eukprot:scaffold22004_cov92-Isochrysis_galbana.AAC.7
MEVSRPVRLAGAADPTASGAADAPGSIGIAQAILYRRGGRGACNTHGGTLSGACSALRCCASRRRQCGTEPAAWRRVLLS